MKRYAFFPVLYDPEKGYVPSVDTLTPITYKIVSKTDVIGQELRNFFLTRCAKANFGAVHLLSNSYLFPDAPLDILLSAIGNDPSDGNDILFAMNQACTARQLLTPWMTTPAKPWNQWSFGEVILNIAQQIDPLYPNLNNFDVPEPE